MPTKKIIAGYHEGDAGYVKVRYLGATTVKVAGCVTRHKYLFTTGVIRVVDLKDADCLFDIMAGSFESFVENEDVQSSSAETEF